MSSDVAEVEKVLQVYFDGLYEGDTRKLGQAFHPASHLYSVGADGKAADFPRTDWFKMVESRKSAKDSGSERRDRIVSIDFSGPGTLSAPPSIMTVALAFVVFAIATAKSNVVPVVLPVTVG